MQELKALEIQHVVSSKAEDIGMFWSEQNKCTGSPPASPPSPPPSPSPSPSPSMNIYAKTQDKTSWCRAASAFRITMALTKQLPSLLGVLKICWLAYQKQQDLVNSRYISKTKPILQAPNHKKLLNPLSPQFLHLKILPFYHLPLTHLHLRLRYHRPRHHSPLQSHLVFLYICLSCVIAVDVRKSPLRLNRIWGHDHRPWESYFQCVNVFMVLTKCECERRWKTLGLLMGCWLQQMRHTVSRDSVAILTRFTKTGP